MDGGVVLVGQVDEGNKGVHVRTVCFAPVLLADGCDDFPRKFTIRIAWVCWWGVLGDMGDSISRRNKRGAFVCDLVSVILRDGGNGGRLD